MHLGSDDAPWSTGGQDPWFVLLNALEMNVLEAHAHII